jgi:DNA-binding response OmpR family regulator
LARIVIVEDDFDLSRVIKDMLEDIGHEVVAYVQPSPDVPEHLKMYGADLLVVDARLNDSVTGWEIIEAVRGAPETRELPIIVCSGAVDQIEAHRAQLEAYGIPALVKPFDLNDLEALVNSMLKRQSVA